MEILKIYGGNIKRKREYMNKTISWLSNQTGYNRNSIATLELGEHDVHLSVALKIAKALDAGFVDLFERSFDVSKSTYVNDDYYAIFTENLIRRMKRMCVTQTYFHSRINLEASNLNRILNRKVDPRLGTLIKISGAIDMKFEESFKRKEVK